MVMFRIIKDLKSGLWLGIIIWVLGLGLGFRVKIVADELWS